MKTSKLTVLTVIAALTLSLGTVTGQTADKPKTSRETKVRNAARKHPKQAADYKRHAVMHPKEAKALAKDANRNPGTTKKYYKAAERNPDKYKEIKRDAEKHPAKAKKIYKNNKGQLKHKSPGENYNRYRNYKQKRGGGKKKVSQRVK
jgi:DsbC/DsbD-like thiol-disulfide interchange protein